MQGDLHRSKSKDRTRTRHHSVSKLLSGVDDMRIQDSFDYQYQSDDDVIIDFIITVYKFQSFTTLLKKNSRDYVHRIQLTAKIIEIQTLKLGLL
jgi:hypothetical protein